MSSLYDWRDRALNAEIMNRVMLSIIDEKYCEKLDMIKKELHKLYEKFDEFQEIYPEGKYLEMCDIFLKIWNIVT